METPVANRILQSIADLPNPDKTQDEFWKTLHDPSFKGTVNIMLIHAASQFDPISLDNKQCRSQLAKIYALANILNAPDSFVSSLKNQEPIPRNDLE